MSLLVDPVRLSVLVWARLRQHYAFCSEVTFVKGQAA